MSLRISIGLLSIVLAGASFAAQPKADTRDWMACTATPGRACVLDRALDVSRAMATDSWRVNALIAIASAQAAAHRRRETAAASEDALQMLRVGEIDGRWRANALGASPPPAVIGQRSEAMTPAESLCARHRGRQAARES